jgi:hypothetical protein
MQQAVPALPAVATLLLGPPPRDRFKARRMRQQASAFRQQQQRPLD